MDKKPIKYVFDNWNRAMEEDPVKAYKFISHMLKGNLYAFVNKLLNFEYNKEFNIYVPKKERRFGAKRN